MKVVITHSNSDCDAFASQIAAQTLDPAIRVVLSRRVAPRVHQFLSLHRDAFELTTLEALDVSAIDAVTLVDVRDRGRLREHQTLLDRLDHSEHPIRLEVWDHHEASDDDLDADVTRIERVGATTTLFVEEMRGRGLSIDPVRATLFALAIHVDTGSLTYDTTTERDLMALGWLMTQGTNLEIVERYLRMPLTEGQQLAFLRLMDSITIEDIHGVKIGIGGVSLEDGVDGLSFVTTQALSLHRLGALFAAFHIRGKKLQIVGRARHDGVHVGEAMRALGGGGHAAAGAATIKTTDPLRAVARLREHLRAVAGRAADLTGLLEPEIPTVDASISIGEAARRMSERGQRYVFVRNEDGALIGAFDHTFVATARIDGRLELPVKSAMHHSVPTVRSSLGVGALTEEFQDTDAGLLLVCDADEQPVGALLRSRWMRALYEGDARRGPAEDP